MKALYSIIPLMLFLDLVPSSTADAIHALRRCFRGVFVYVLFKKRTKTSYAVGKPSLIYFNIKDGKEAKEASVLPMFF